MDQAQIQTDVKYKTCSNCGKDIEEPKYRMHEATCARNNYRCAQCGEVVPKADKEHHEQENHTQVPCQYCKVFTSEKKGLPAHEAVCEMRPKQCLYCELQLPGDKYYEHLNYCGSKTTKCDMCKQNVMNKDLESHVVEGTCGFYQEIEKQKVQNDLAKFQQEEQKRVANVMIDKQKQEQRRKEQEYIQRQGNSNISQQFRGGMSTNMPHEIPSTGLGISRSHPTQQRSAFEDDDLSGNVNQTTTDEETQKLIAKMLQEEMDEEEARKLMNNDNQQIPSNLGGGYDDQYDQHSPRNVRPSQDIYEDQLIGGPDSYSYSTTINRPGGRVTQTYYSSNMPHAPASHHFSGFNPIQQPSYQYQEDSHMSNDFDNEEEQLNRALAASLDQNKSQGQSNPSGQHDIDDVEEEIMRQILEQSKKDAGQ